MTKSIICATSALAAMSLPMRALSVVNKIALFLSFPMLLICAGCGANLIGSSSRSTTPPSAPPPPAPTAQNELPVVVSAGTGSSPSMNRPFVSVTVCIPGSSNCQTINNVLVDTGSIGLRLFSSVVSLPLPVQQISQVSSTYECYGFVSGYAWGPLATADVKLSGETAAGAAIQLMGDTTYTPPASCTGGLGALSSPQSAGVNGFLGVAGQNDCANVCDIGPNTIYHYYVCQMQHPCTPTLQQVAQQVWNPVALFPTDNNGVVFDIPEIPAGGAVNVQGSLYFGIGTESNNQLESATIYNFPLVAYMNTGKYAAGFDSGTPYIGLLNDGVFGFPTCGVIYCPASPTQLSVEIAGANGEYTILNAVAADDTPELDQGMTADSTYIGPSYSGNSVTLGFSFFYGRRILFSWGAGTAGQNAFIAF